LIFLVHFIVSTGTTQNPVCLLIINYKPPSGFAFL